MDSMDRGVLLVKSNGESIVCVPLPHSPHSYVCKQYVYRYPSWSAAGIHVLDWAVGKAAASKKTATETPDSPEQNQEGGDSGSSGDDGDSGGGGEGQSSSSEQRRHSRRSEQRHVGSRGVAQTAATGAQGRPPPDIVVMNMCAWAKNMSTEVLLRSVMCRPQGRGRCCSGQSCAGRREDGGAAP